MEMRAFKADRSVKQYALKQKLLIAPRMNDSIWLGGLQRVYRKWVVNIDKKEDARLRYKKMCDALILSRDARI